MIHICLVVIDMKPFSIILCLLFFSIVPRNLHAEDETQAPNIPKVRGIIGCSLPELLHVGARYRINHMELGVNVGTAPSNGSLLTLSADCLFRIFLTRNEYGQAPWYGKIGISALHEDGEYEINDYTYGHMRLGHEFALSKTIALQLDGGLMFEMSHQEIQKKPSSSWFDFDFDFPILPSIGLSTVFYL